MRSSDLVPHLALLVSGLLQAGCAAPLDYHARAVVVRGRIETVSGRAAEGQVVNLIQPESGRHWRALRSQPRSEWSISAGRMVSLTSSRAGLVEHRFAGFRRACPLYLVPPVFTLFCDRAQYVVMEVVGRGARTFAVEEGAVSTEPVDESNAEDGLTWTANAYARPVEKDADDRDLVAERVGDSEEVLEVRVSTPDDRQ